MLIKPVVKKLLMICAVSAMFWACKKTTGQPVPAGIVGYWSIQAAYHTFNYRDGHSTKTDTIVTKPDAGYYNFNADGTFRKLDSESSYVVAGSFSATQSGNTFQLVLNGNNGISKNSTAVIAPNNGLVISSITELPGDPKISSVTTIQVTVKK